MSSKALDVLKGPAGYGVAIIAGGLVIWLLWDKVAGAAKATANAAAGVATGNNAITDAARTDAYKGKGIVGTAGAAVDNTLGGLTSVIGEKIGGGLYDLTHTDDGKSYWELMAEKISGD